MAIRTQKVIKISTMSKTGGFEIRSSGADTKMQTSGAMDLNSIGRISNKKKYH
jgi:hypothetical protein